MSKQQISLDKPNRRSILVFWLRVLLLVVAANFQVNATLAEKTGLDEVPNLSTLLKEVAKSDVQIDCFSNDKIQITGAGVDPKKYFSLDQVREILTAQRKKDFLVATLSKFYPGRYKADSFELSTFQDSLSKLGYKRRLILGKSDFGIEVIADSTEPTQPVSDSEIAQARALEDAFRMSEWIGITRYVDYEKRDNITLAKPPSATYRPIKCLKGPPLGISRLTILFEFTPPESQEKRNNWKFDESIMPKGDTEWIIFIPNAVPIPGKCFLTYKGSFGRMEATEKNLEALKAVIRRHHGDVSY